MAGLLLAAPALEAATVRLQVDGLSGDLQKNVRARLSTIGSDEVSNDGRFRARVSVITSPPSILNPAPRLRRGDDRY
jgi:translocation and assembly module TamA